MRKERHCAKVNVTLLAILIAVVAAICVSLVAARQLRRNIQTEQALAEGKAAYERRDWSAAAQSFRDYLMRTPDDLEVLRKYAESLMATRPLDVSSVNRAIPAYRRIMGLDPSDRAAPEKLAMLYVTTNNFDELASIAKSRIEQDPNDHRAPLWLADALIRTNRQQAARDVLEAFIKRLEALPERHVEYVRACVHMSQLAGDFLPDEFQKGGEIPPSPTCQDWLNRAVVYDPESAEALFHRARYRRQMAAAETTEEHRQRLLDLARKDLEVAAGLDTQDPRIRYSLAAEWMLHREFDRAAAEVEAVDNLPQTVLADHFFDIEDWKVNRFLISHQLAMQRRTAIQAAALADDILTLFSRKEEGHRHRVLPSAIGAYLAAGRVSDARQCLDEYLTLVKNHPLQAGTARETATLNALVEAAEGRHHNVIALLQPIAAKDPGNPQLARMLAQAYSRTGQATQAADALERCRRLNPQDLQIARELARQYAAANDFERAFDVARKAELLDPTDIDLTLLRIGIGISRITRLGGSPDVPNLKTLSAQLDELRRQHPDRVGIRILQSVVAASLGLPERAEQELKQAIEECSEPLRAQMLLIRHYVGAGRMDDAMAICEAACKCYQDTAEPWLALADLHWMNGDYDSARQSLRQALETVTDRQVKRTLSTRLASLELAYGDRLAGIDLLKELATDPQEIRARLLLLGSREMREDPTAAAKLVDGLRQAEGQNGLLWRLHQASLWLESSDWPIRQQEIRNLFEHCIRTNPAWPAPVLLLGGMYERQREWKQAEDLYRQGLLGNPGAAEITERLLNLLVRQARFPEAEKMLRQIQSPQAAADWRVRIAIGSGDFSQALDGLRLKISNGTQDAGSRIELARLLYQETKDAAQALRYLDEAQAIAPDSRQLATVRASILRSEGDTVRARRVLDDYVSAYGTFEAYWMRAVYLIEEGEVEAAEQDYRQLTTLADNAAVGYELLGTFYASLGRFDLAVAAVEEGLSAHPEGLRLKRSLMRLLFSRARGQDRERALGILAELEERQLDDSELMMIRALQALEDPTPQSLTRAKDGLENIVQRDPGDVNAHLILIRIAMREQDYRTASNLAIRALSSNPGNPALLLARARGELALGYPVSAAELTQQVLELDPNSVEAVEVFVQAALSPQGGALREQGRRLANTAAHRNPSNESLLILRSHIHAALGEPEGGIPKLQAYCQTDEGRGSVNALVTLADLYRMAGQMAKADKAIQRAEELDSHHQAVVHTRFIWLLAQNRFDDLKGISSAYIHAKEQDPTRVLRAAGTLVAVAPLELKGEGILLFRHAVSQWPQLEDARLGLASSLYQIGDAEAAEKKYRDFLRQRQNDTRALNDLAWILQEKFQRYDEALALAERGLRLAPDNVHLLDTKGSILLNMPDRLSEAKACFDAIVRISSRPVSLDPRREVRACLQMGRIYVQLNESAQARKYLSRALDINGKADVLTTEDRSEIERLMHKIGFGGDLFP